MYHRFVLTFLKAMPNNEGIFATASTLWSVTPDEQDSELNELMEFFNHHLEAPKKVPVGVFWFKDGSKCIEKAKQLALLLKRYGYEVTHYECEDPGEITFEDKHQVVAKYKRRVKCVARSL